MISILLKFALLVVPFAALASEAKQQERSNSIEPSHFILTSSSQCSKGCDNEYIRCAKKGGGKDMKQCSDERKVCYRQCSAAASRAECTNGCEGAYIACAKKNGKDLKQCNSERKACYRRCS